MLEVAEKTRTSDPTFDVPPGYKITELGFLPEERRVARLADVTEPTKQVNPASAPDRRIKDVDVSAVSSESLRIATAMPYRGDEAPGRARKQVRTGDVIFATIRPYLKRIAVVPPELNGELCSTAFCVVRANRAHADPQFLFHALSADDFVRRVAGHQHGSSYPAVTDKHVLRELIPLPPLPEQRAIAHILSTVQRAREATEAVIAATRELKKSLMRHLFTYGPVPVDQAGQVPLNETEVGLVPEHWDVQPLGAVALIERGKFAHRPRNDPDFYGGCVPFIQTGDVASCKGHVRT